MQAARMDTNDFAAGLRAEIIANRIRLPTLPDVALRVKAAVEDACSTQELAALIAQDIALSGRLVQLANSPLYRGAVEVESIRAAVTRLGTRMVRGFVIGLAMRQMFNTSSELLAKAFRDIWQDGIQVAAISRMLADASPETDPEEAMLGGLLHNIGALPILARLDQAQAQAEPIDAAIVHQLVDELAPEIGTRILRSWKLPESLVAVPEGCHVLNRDSGPRIDYVDIVLASRLQYLFSEGLIDVTLEMSNLPALEKLGIHFEAVVLDQDSAAVWATQIRDTFDS
jgi:HD-like signal output (HDOD) protein